MGGLGGAVNVLEVKSHAPARDDAFATDGRYRRFGSRRADEAARKGAAMHPWCGEANALITRAARLVQFVVKFLGRAPRAVGLPIAAPSSREAAAHDGRRRQVP